MNGGSRTHKNNNVEDDKSIENDDESDDDIDTNLDYDYANSKEDFNNVYSTY